MDATFWSPEVAKRAHDYGGESASHARMRRGPFLDNGHTLVVPSEPGWWKREAVAFWKSKGFTWCDDAKCWLRDTRQALGGKTYTPDAWLQAARRRFYEFYPNLNAHKEVHNG